MRSQLVLLYQGQFHAERMIRQGVSGDAAFTWLEKWRVVVDQAHEGLVSAHTAAEALDELLVDAATASQAAKDAQR